MTTTPRPLKPPMRFGPAVWNRIQQNSDFKVRRAVITTPSRVELQAIAIVSGDAPRVVLELRDAYELAEALASVLDSITGAASDPELRRTPDADSVLDAHLGEAFRDEPAGDETGNRGAGI